MLHWVARLESELENLRAALAFFRDSGDANSHARLAVALCEFWLAREYYDEGLRLVESALSATLVPGLGVDGSSPSEGFLGFAGTLCC